MPDDGADEQARDAARYREYLAQGWWPRPEDPVAGGGAVPPPPRQAPGPHPVAPLPPASPPPPRAASPLRPIGVGALGLVLGIVAGFVVQDAVAIALFAGGALDGGNGFPLELAALFAFLVPTTAIAGVIVALLIDRRVRRRAGRGGR